MPKPLHFLRMDSTSGGKRMPVWLFRCDCGAEFSARLYAVNCGRTSSCGCKRGKANLRHGASVDGRLTPEYRAWRCMLTRAKNPRIRNARRYVLRGITVATEWDSGGDGRGFERFLAHVGPKPDPTFSLDRIDNDRGYEPGNVRWASATQQASNVSSNCVIEIGGERATLTAWATRAGLPARVVRDRIDKLGWSIEDALSRSLRPQGGA